jgi:hypothetical protein
MKDLARGVEYASAIYDLRSLSLKLPVTAVLKILNVGGLDVLLHGDDEDEEGKKGNPNVIAVYNYEEDPSTIWVVCQGLYF